MVSFMMTTQRGMIHLFIGPKFSGKSDKLIRLSKRYHLSGQNVVLVCHTQNPRYIDNPLEYGYDYIRTHDDCKMPVILSSQLYILYEQIENYDVILIDQGHGFKDLFEAVQQLAKVGKTVVVAALNGNAEQEPYTSVIALTAHVDSVKMLTAICDRCGEEALYTYCKPSADYAIMDVLGGDGTDHCYTPLCRMCLSETNANKENDEMEVVVDEEAEANAEATANKENDEMVMMAKAKAEAHVVNQLD